MATARVTKDPQVYRPHRLKGGRVDVYRQCFLNYNVCSNYPGILINVDADSLGARVGLTFCISNELSGDADTAGLGTTF